MKTREYEEVKADVTGRKFYKNQINPIISPTKITIELNALLRQFKPMTLVEAQTISADDYLKAFNEYSRIISHISDFLMSYVPSKQTFCAFCDITSDIYNEMLVDTTYSQVFKSFEDAFVDSNFTMAQAGVVDKTVTLAKLQTRDAGHNLIKNPEILNLSVNNITDKSQVREKLDKFSAMVKSLPKGK